MKVVLAGIMAQHPYGGVAWCSLMYAVGLRRLGHEVFYIEDTGDCVYDLDQNARTLDPAYGLAHLDRCFRTVAFDGRWSFVNYDGTHHGSSAVDVRRFCRDADLLVNLSGGTWFWRDEYARIPHRVFIDSDPAFTQLAIAGDTGWYAAFFAGFTRLFTFGANIGTAASPVPVGALRWHHTWQPVTLADWNTETPPGPCFTTVMTWRTESFRDVGGDKADTFRPFVGLPLRTRQRLELAINGPRARLEAHGWRTIDAIDISRTPDDYRRYIHQSRAEWAVAKRTYVATHSGWFSDRTACYLASGRPALVQDTGWTGHLPSGDGLLAFTTPEEALAGIDRINSAYEHHRRCALAIAREHFDADRVLPRLLDEACA
jgi:hypothetical protein